MAAPAVAYIGAASNDNRVFFLWIKTLLKKAGAGSVHLVPLAAARADLAKARSLLQAAEMIFVSGGDVEARHERPGTDGLAGPAQGTPPGRQAVHRSVGREHHAGPRLGALAQCAMMRRRKFFPAWGWRRSFAIPMPKKKIGRNSKSCCAYPAAETGFGIPSGAALWVTADGALSALGKPVPRFHFRDGRLQRDRDVNPV